jgi:hypothetical protein
MKGPSGFRIVMGVVLVVALIAAAAAIGWMAYNAGLTQGAAQAAGASLGAAQAAGAQQGVVPYAMYGPHFMQPFGFGFLGCLVPLAFLFLVFGLFRLVVCGGMRRHMHGGWGAPGGFAPDRMREHWHQRMDEWHREAHAAGSGDSSAKDQSA